MLFASKLAGTDAQHEAAQTCMQPRMRWADRLAALTQLLEAARDRGVVLALIDPDALRSNDSRPQQRWEDRTFASERAELLSALISTARKGGWVILRPTPSPEVTKELRGMPDEEGPDDVQLASNTPNRLTSAWPAVPPAVRPILKWLLAERVLSAVSAARLIEAVLPADPTPAILDTAYDHLPSTVRATAQRLSALRPPVVRNGVLGPFSWGTGPEDIPRADVEVLVQAGFIQPSPVVEGHARWHMPNPVRRFLYLRAEVAKPEELEKEHGWLATQPSAGDDVEARSELHHHAVQSGDVERAEQSATFYGSDLRALAYKLSRRAQSLDEPARRRQEFERASNLFGTITTRFDESDAYAWEYMAFNLARAYPKPSPDIGGRIRKGYQTAFDLEPDNLLYHGRLLGYRARCGEDVRTEIKSSLSRYLATYRDSAAVSWFARSAIDGLRASRFKAEATRLIGRFGRAIEGPPGDGGF